MSKSSGHFIGFINNLISDKLIIRLVLLLLICVPLGVKAFPVQPHHTTAFIGSRGSIDTLWSVSTYSTDSFWNKNNKKLPSFNDFREQDYMLYAEYAVNARNSLTLDGGFSVITEEVNGDSGGIADLELGWKHLLRKTKTSACTAQLVGIIPTSDRDPPLRYGRGGLELSLLYSQIFHLRNTFWWYDFGLGYRWYEGFPSDQLRSLLALGVFVNPNLRFIVSNELDYGFFNGDSSGSVSNITFNPNYRLYMLKFECVFKVVKHTFLTLGAYKHVWGQNVGAGGGYYGGIWLVF